jgi:hypothetical protein
MRYQKKTTPAWNGLFDTTRSGHPMSGRVPSWSIGSFLGLSHRGQVIEKPLLLKLASFHLNT